MGRGLGTTQRSVLELVEAKEAAWVSTIADELGLTRKAVHSTLDRLTARGLLFTEVRGWMTKVGEAGPLASRLGVETVTADHPGAVLVRGPWGPQWQCPRGIPTRERLALSVGALQDRVDSCAKFVRAFGSGKMVSYRHEGGKWVEVLTPYKRG